MVERGTAARKRDFSRSGVQLPLTPFVFFFELLLFVYFHSFFFFLFTPFMISFTPTLISVDPSILSKSYDLRVCGSYAYMWQRATAGEVERL